MVYQAEVLEHHAYLTSDLGNFDSLKRCSIPAGQTYQSAAWSQREIHQFKQGGFAGTARASHKVKRTVGKVKGDVAQDFGPCSVTDANILKLNHATSALPLREA